VEYEFRVKNELFIDDKPPTSLVVPYGMLPSPYPLRITQKLRTLLSYVK